MRYFVYLIIMISIGLNLNPAACQAGQTVKIGLNRPETGPYLRIGIDQERAAQLASEEINRQGGILGRRIDLVMLDSQSNPDISEANVLHLIQNEKVKMIFGGASSGVAIRVSEVCQKQKTVFMATVSAANATTGIKGHRYTFRTCYNAWMGAKALGNFLKETYQGSRFFYIVADYSWGRSAETSIRKFSGTEDRNVHKSSYTTFPGATEQEFRNKLKLAEIRETDVLVLAQFGNDMTRAVRIATEFGLKDKMQIAVPIMELSMAEGAGPESMEGIMGTSDWNWRVPYEYKHKRGIRFVEKFSKRFGRYPCWGAATAYTGLWQYKAAVERAGTFDSEFVVKALEGHTFSLLKDNQQWRGFDNQNVQSVYLVRGKKADKVIKSDNQQDYFDNIFRYKGPDVVRSHREWKYIRRQARKPVFLEKFAGESY